MVPGMPKYEYIHDLHYLTMNNNFLRYNIPD